MPSTPYITEVEVDDDHSLILLFENGERRRLDMKPYFETEVFSPLRDPTFFRRVQVVHGSLEWPGERDLAYDSLYAESEPLHEQVTS